MNNKIALSGIVVILLIALAIYEAILLNRGPVVTTYITSLTTTVATAPITNGSEYRVQPASIPKSSEYTLVEASMAPGSILRAFPGVQYTAILDMQNTSSVNTSSVSFPTIPKNYPIQVYSIVYIANSSKSAQNILTYYSSRMAGAPSLSIPRIGDVSDSFMLQNPNASQTLFMVQFTYKNVYAKVGIYEKPNSSAVSLISSVSQGLLNSIKSGSLTTT